MKNIPDIISAATSILALFLSIVSYTKSRKIEKQQYKLNAHELKKIEEEENRQRLAILSVSVPLKEGRRILLIENNGYSSACDIKITPINECVIVTSIVEPFHLLPNSSVLLNIIPYRDKERAKFNIAWKDEAGQHEELFTVAL